MLKSLTIVIVEDDKAVLDSVSAYFESLGHEVIALSDALEALDVLCERPCDLLLADVELKGLDGLELARMARRHQPDIAIIIMTAYDEQYPLSAALKAGADAYLTKPFSLKTLGLIFKKTYWETVSRVDWWELHAAKC